MRTSDLIRKFIFPLQLRHRNPATPKLLREFKQLEYASPATIRRIQSARLHALLQYAPAHVPYYRGLFSPSARAGNKWDAHEKLQSLPILTKTIVQERQRELLAANARKEELIPNASGGSTGRPVHVYQDQCYWDYSRASQYFMEGWWGIEPGMRTASVWGVDRDIPTNGLKQKLSNAVSQLRICNAFRISGAEMLHFAQMLAGWRPQYVIGYASALYLFAQFLLEHPELHLRPKAVKSTAEVMGSHEREVIQEAFQSPVFDFYGSREVNCLAAECQYHCGLHVNSLTRVVEVLDQNDQPVQPGIPGRIVVTDLTNFAMPMIRYENEDIGVWREQACACGRPFPLLEKVLGRKSDFISGADGKLIHGEFFTHLFYEFPQVVRFKVIQESLQHVRLQIVLRDGAAPNELESVRSKICAVMGAASQCTLEVVENIESASSGKHRFTVSSVPVHWGDVRVRKPEGGRNLSSLSARPQEGARPQP